MHGNKRKKHSYWRIFRALGYSIDGLIAAWHNEQAFRQELVIGILLAPLLYLAQISVEQKAVLSGLYLLLLLVELLNSSIESLADAFTQQPHPLVKRAKDMASAAVLLCLIGNIAAWIIIFRHEISATLIRR
jgi:diacylglycerol kinase (ATP)